MKFSYNWIRELVEGLETSPRELERAITIKTAECEGVEEVGSLLAGACAARVITCEPVGKKNQKAQVETEKYGTKTLVCGAPNCRPGLRTVYVPLGKKTIDGVESDGMLASEAELGIGRDDDGIVELTEELTVGPDHIIEVDNKSLTHRPDLWGHHGMAREVAAITGKKLLDPVAAREFPGDASIKVSIRDYALCPRYSALVFDNVQVGPSPLWLKYRLEAIGLNSINNIVDVTNYVLAELPQPMHAFDADKLRGGEIIVRSANNGETMAALNGESYTLDSSNLVIADAEGAVAIAGVIGGADSAISASTTRIVLESANFNASSVRKTSSKLKLRTDASMRFEKALDPLNTLRGLQRAYDLLVAVCPGIRLVGGIADNMRELTAAPVIELSLDWLDRKLGRALPAGEVRQILESLEFGVSEVSPRVFSVTVPSWRATKDVSIREDVVEEVGRMVGYGTIVPTAPATPARVPPTNPEREFQHSVREMCTAQGFTEVYNYSFVSEEMARAFALDVASHVQVSNPIAADQNLLRTTLLPGLWKNIGDNARHLDSFRLFEIGKEIHPDREVPHLGCVVYAKDDGKASLLELRRVAECLAPGISIRPTDAKPYEHPKRTADVFAGETRIGRLFEFHPKMVAVGRAAVLDLDLIELQCVQRGSIKYQPLRRFPESGFDLSIVASARTLIADVERGLRSLAGPELLSVAFLADFAKPDGTRSLSFRLTLGASDRTLTSDEVASTRTRIIEGMRSSGYDLKV